MTKGFFRLIALLGVFALCAAIPAIAQQSRPYNFFVAGEFGFAVSPEQFTDYYTTGYGIGGGIEYAASPNWSLIGMIDVKFFSPAAGMIKDWWTDPGEWPLATNIDVSGGGVTAGTLAILGKGSLRSPGSTLWPYLKGGFGLTISGADEVKVDFNSGMAGRITDWSRGIGSQTNLSVILGIGVEKTLGNGGSSIFIDAGIHMIMQEDVNPTIAPITIGFKF
jgi:hypothetical protein